MSTMINRLVLLILAFSLALLVVGCKIETTIIPGIGSKYLPDSGEKTFYSGDLLTFDVQNHLEDPLKNYQIKIVLHRGIGESRGQDAFIDLEVLDWPPVLDFFREGKSLDYWIESYTGTTCTVWVKISSLVGMSEGFTRIGLVWNTTNHYSPSAGSETWTVYEDMERSISLFEGHWRGKGLTEDHLDPWLGLSSLRLEDFSKVETSGFKYRFTKKSQYWYTLNEGLRCLFWIKIAPDRGGCVFSLQDYPEVAPFFDGPHMRFSTNGTFGYDSRGTWIVLEDYLPDTWIRVEFTALEASDTFSVSLDNLSLGTDLPFNSKLPSLDLFRLGGTLAGTPLVWIDNLCIGRYVSPEPTIVRWISWKEGQRVGP